MSRSRLIRADFLAPLMVRRPTPSDLPLTMACVRLTPALPSSLVTVNARLIMLDCTLRIAMLRPFHFCATCAGYVVRVAELLPSLSLYIILIFFKKTSLFYFFNDSGYLGRRSLDLDFVYRDRETQKYRF